MSYLNVQEAQGCCEAFLLAMYGTELFDRWQTLKQRMNFYTEQEFIRWVLEILENVQANNMSVGRGSRRYGDDSSISVKLDDESWMDDDNFNRYLQEAKQISDSGRSITGKIIRKRGRPRKEVPSHMDDNTDSASKHAKSVETKSSSQCKLSSGLEAIPMLDFEGEDVSIDLAEESSSKMQTNEAAPESSASHSLERVRRFPCQYCGKRYFKRRDKTRHEETVHLRRFVKPCPVCYTMINRKDHLRRHIRQLHPDYDLGLLSFGMDASTNTSGDIFGEDGKAADDNSKDIAIFPDTGEGEGSLDEGDDDDILVEPLDGGSQADIPMEHGVVEKTKGKSDVACSSQQHHYNIESDVACSSQQQPYKVESDVAYCSEQQQYKVESDVGHSSEQQQYNNSQHESSMSTLGTNPPRNLQSDHSINVEMPQLTEIQPSQGHTIQMPQLTKIETKSESPSMLQPFILND